MTLQEQHLTNLKRKIEKLDEQIQLYEAKKLILKHEVRLLEESMQRNAETAHPTDSSRKEQ